MRLASPPLHLPEQHSMHRRHVPGCWQPHLLTLRETSQYSLTVDGDSANICIVGLAMNCVLCNLLKTTVQQHRLPPDHSHTWHTDGMFAAIEGWLTHAGFKGCHTVSEMVVFLQTMFARSDAYKHQKVRFRFPPPCSSLLTNLRQKSA